jgi:hypothetical protein
VVAETTKLKRRARTTSALAVKTKKRKTVEPRPTLPVQVCDPTPKDESVDDVFEKIAPSSEERTWTDKARAMVAPKPTLLLPMKLERVYDAFCALETVISVRPRQSYFSLEELKGPVEAVCDRFPS